MLEFVLSMFCVALVGARNREQDREDPSGALCLRGKDSERKHKMRRMEGHESQESKPSDCMGTRWRGRRRVACDTQNMRDTPQPVCHGPETGRTTGIRGLPGATMAVRWEGQPAGGLQEGGAALRRRLDGLVSRFKMRLALENRGPGVTGAG